MIKNNVVSLRLSKIDKEDVDKIHAHLAKNERLTTSASSKAEAIRRAIHAYAEHLEAGYAL